MAYASTLATALDGTAAGGAGVALAGRISVAFSGTFVVRNAAPNIGLKFTAEAHLELSTDDGATWIVMPDTRVSAPTVKEVFVGTGGQLRVVAANGGTGISINAVAAVVP